jgi:hypothetical protein
MDNAAVVIDEKHRRGEAVERVSECCSFNRAQVDDLANSHRAPHVGDDQLYSPARLVIDDAVPFVANDRESSRRSS